MLNFASTGPRAITAVYAGDEVFRGGKAVVTDHSVLGPATLRIDDVERVEGNAGSSAFVFSVSLDNALGTPVSVQFATADGSATAPADYASTSGTLNFSGSTTLQVVSVDVAGDAAVEPTEEFVVNLSAASGAAIGDGQGIGRIVNDDSPPPPNLRISDASVQERADAQLATMSFTLTLDRAPDAAASVRVRTRNGSATAGSDYTAIDFVQEFQPDGRWCSRSRCRCVPTASSNPARTCSSICSTPRACAGGRGRRGRDRRSDRAGRGQLHRRR